MLQGALHGVRRGAGAPIRLKMLAQAAEGALSLQLAPHGATGPPSGPWWDSTQPSGVHTAHSPNHNRGLETATPAQQPQDPRLPRSGLGDGPAPRILACPRPGLDDGPAPRILTCPRPGLDDGPAAPKANLPLVRWRPQCFRGGGSLRLLLLLSHPLDWPRPEPGQKEN